MPNLYQPPAVKGKKVPDTQKYSRIGSDLVMSLIRKGNHVAKRAVFLLKLAIFT